MRQHPSPSACADAASTAASGSRTTICTPLRSVPLGASATLVALLSTAFSLAREGVAANFVTDRVDFTDGLIFNATPGRILDIGLGLTKRVVWRQDYMPFEYTIFLDAAQGFDPEVAVFDSGPTHG